MGKSVVRLYTQFQPEHYNVSWRIDEAAMRFSGNVVITGRKVGRPSQRLTFHANGLKVTSAKIVFHDKRGDHELAIKRINAQKTLHELRMHTEGMSYPGRYTIEIEFNAPITDGMTGIYPCYYNDDGSEKKLFATQFESHHAREAFPCIDEPEAKATFDVSLDIASGLTALSNLPVAKTEKQEKRQLVIFETSPKMSTYLLAFVYGDVHKKSTQTKSGVDINVWATAAQPADSLNFALDVSKKSIEFFENYFGIPYPLPKLDHIALPDFSSGAMENWGLVTYRERVLLAYPEETAQSTYEQIALVIAHETSHQWFGNLVTMRWWDDLWLNESFANMMEYQAVDSMFPEWQVWDNFIANEGYSAFRRDATAGVQSVRVDVHHPDEISSLFDPSIVYAKGGRLLYMLMSYIGEDAFRRGLAAYFEKHAYGNTTGSDLWTALSETSDKDIAAFMDPWLERSGFPVVHVEQSDITISLSQEQFLDDPAKADKTRLWPVPLFANAVKAPEVLLASQVKFDLPTAEPLLLNNGVRGHYIVDYLSPATNAAIEKAVSGQTFAKPDRLMLLNSSAMIARAGYKSYGDTLRLLAAYEKETSEPVWGIIGTVLGEVRRFIDGDTSLEKKIKAFTAKLIQEEYSRLGWDALKGESTADQKLRGHIIGLGVYAEDMAITQKARQLFDAYRSKQERLPAELRAVIMSVPVRTGDSEAIDFLLDLHDSTNNSDLKNDACDALTTTQDPLIATRLLTRLKNGKLIKPQDVDRWLVYLLRNRYTRDVAWQWMVDNWQWLEATFQNDKSYDYLPRYAASCVNTRAYEQKFHNLFDDKISQPILKRNIEMGFEEISNRLAWLERDLTAIQTFFK